MQKDSHPISKSIFHFLEALPDIFVLKDGEGRWIWANKAKLQLFGLEEVDYVGKKDSELAEFSQPLFRNALLFCEQTDEKAWQNRKLSVVEETIDLPDGSQRVFETYKLPFFDESGKRQTLFVFARDVTKHKRLTDLDHKTEEQEVLIRILSVWQKSNLSWRQKMEEVLKILISIPWLSLDTKAAFFEAVSERKELRMAVSINFMPEHKTACERLHYMDCLCGRAAGFQKTQYIPHHQEMSTDRCPIHRKHYHYIIPIYSRSNVPDITDRFLGCVSLYTVSPHKEHERFCRFFDAVADVISLAIKDERLSQRLSDRLTELMLATEMLQLGIIKYDSSTKVMHWSENVYNILGLNPTIHRPSLKNYFKRVGVIDRPRVTQAFRLLLKEGTPIDLKHAIRHSDSEQRIIHLKVVVRRLEGAPLIYGILQDITLNVAMEEQLSLLINIIEKTNEALVVTDKDQRILLVNKAFTAITGYEPQEVIGQTPAILKSGYHDKQFYEKMWKSLNTTNSWQGEIWNRHKDGHVYPEWLSIYVLRDNNDMPFRYISMFHEITKEKDIEAKLDYYKNYDALTDLPNKTLFIDRVSTIIASRDEDNSVAVIVLDIDDFKYVNEYFGYTKGDMVIQDIASRLSTVLPSDAILCRLGGDEFAILYQCFDERDILRLLSGLEKAMEAPFGVDDIHLTASIGVSLAPIDGREPNDLLKKAETAMYAAKNAGKAQSVFFRKELSDSLERLLKLEKLLRSAIENKEIYLVYQPKVELKSGRIVSVEALARWHSPDMGFISPAEFIPLAEATKLIGQLGKLIVEKAATQALEWEKQGYELTVAFNLSPVQFKNKGVVEDVLTVIDEVGVRPDFMEIEITEGAVLENEEDAIGCLKEFKKTGISIAMDDFGMGYSSLYYLKRLPIDSLKIDMVFIKELPFDSEACAITKAIISMAKAMGLKTIGEGAETQEAVNFLKEQGADMIQGYVFSPPVTAERITELLQQQRQK